MKKTIALFTLLLSYVTAGAQQPHTVVGYTPNSNTLTALRYGYGNSLETITIAGKTLTTIKVSSNGQPKSISNEFATEDFTFAGTSKVTVTQTVNGETKTSTVSINSDKVLQLRKEFSQIKTSLSGFVGQADKFLESGGASLIGNIINTINDGIENPINMCFQQALDAAKDSKNPIIPIDCLEALVKATKSHESAGDKLKGKMVDYIFQNYGEWRDGWSDLGYKGMMEIDKRQQAENKQKNQNKVDAAKKLLEKGASLDDVSKILDGTSKNGENYILLDRVSITVNRDKKTGGTGGKTGTTPALQGTNTRSTKEILETEYFYFDNPDGTIEAYPEYIYQGLSQRMMSISSSKYANPLKGKPEGALKKYEKVFNLLFARQTRTTVFVFDGQESGQAGVSTTSTYSASLLGLWAAMEEGMREQVGAALNDAHIAHTTSATWRDALKIGKPEELMFNGHEGGHIVYRLDLSNSWLSLMAAARVTMVFDNYFYYDKEYDKIVCVVFSYSEISNPKNSIEAAAFTAVKALSDASGFYDPTTDNTTLASMFERRDMIDFFKKHFHLKKIVTPGTETETKTETKCVATFTGTPQQPKLNLCGEEICIGIDCWLINNDDTKKPEDTKTLQPTKKPKDPEKLKGPEKPKGPTKDKQTRDKRPYTGGVVGQGRKFAVIKHDYNHESIDKPFAENDKYVYFIQPAHMDNAVLAVNKSDGTLTEAVAGKHKGSRPNIISIGAHGGDLYLDVQDRGVVRYNGKDVNTSELLFEIDRGFMDSYKQIVVSPNGRYLAYSGLNCASYVYDLQEKKIIKRFHDGLEYFVVTDDGDFYGANNFRALLYRNNGNTGGDANADIEMSALLKAKPAAMCLIGKDIYLVGGNKVVKTAVKEFSWTESTTLTGNDLELKDAALASDHAGFSYIYDKALNRFAHFSTDSKTSKPLKQLNTGINVGRPRPLTVEVAQNIYIDSKGNIWMVESTGTYFVVVYNPEGLVGLDKLAGKFVKQQK